MNNPIPVWNFKKPARKLKVGFQIGDRSFSFGLGRLAVSFCSFLAVVMLTGASSSSGCQISTANSKEHNSQLSQQDIYNSNGQELPVFLYSQYRNSMIQIETMLATGQDVNTWATWETNGGTDLHVCRAYGYPIPVTAQLSNPLQIDFQPWPGGGNGSVDGVVGQMDPYGVYTSPNAAGTYVLCLDSSGVPHVTWVENNVEAYAWPVTIENGKFVEHPEQASSSTAVHPCKYDPVSKKCVIPK